MNETAKKKRQEWKPRWYRVNVEFDANEEGLVPAGAIGNGSVTIKNVPFVLRRITAQNLTPCNIDFTELGLPPGTFANAVPLYWSFSWRTDSHVYMNDQVALIAGIGSAVDIIDCPSPVKLYPKATATFDVTNLIERTDDTTLQFVLAGVEPAEMYQERL
jgi:hypothetical protein